MSALTPSRPSSIPRPSYAAVLRVPHARRTFLAALAARLAYGTVSLSVLLSVTRAAGSYAWSGVVMAVFGGSAVVLMPVRAALVDRYGPRRALPPMAAAYSAVLCLLAALTWHPGAPPALLAAAALAGCVAPPLGPAMRAAWGRLVEDPALRRRAYSLDGVAEELLFVSGPALVGLLLRFGPPPAGLLLSALLMAAGTCAFVTSPAVRGVTPGKRASGGAAGGAFPAAPVAAAAGLGLALSGADLLVTAFAGQRSYGAQAVPWILGALSVGSAAGGLLHGAVEWRRPAAGRLARLTAALGAALALAGAATGVWTLVLALTVAGVFVAPALTTAYLLADESAAESARNRAGAWVNAAVNAGSSVGAVGAGLALGHLPVGLCFALAGAVALVCAVLVRAVDRS
ncbi:MULTISPECIES: MFS transporter [unclassified Streptomyces]|uniref:MFS transporter n=1 Tax=unclassified Streptomyces TaxID=2593676 RepID=UPI00381698D0